MSDIVVRLNRQIAPIVFGRSETVNGVIVDAIAEIERLRAENERLRTALERIAANAYGLQGIVEDYGHDTNAYNFHAKEYWYQDAMRRKSIANEALNPLADPNSVQSGRTHTGKDG